MILLLTDYSFKYKTIYYLPAVSNSKCIRYKWHSRNFKQNNKKKKNRKHRNDNIKLLTKWISSVLLYLLKKQNYAKCESIRGSLTARIIINISVPVQ